MNLCVEILFLLLQRQQSKGNAQVLYADLIYSQI